MDIVKKLPEGKHNIVVKLSGGADSSLIYYVLCKEYANNKDVNLIVVTLNTDKKPYYIPFAQKIIKRVYDLTGKVPIDHMTISIKHDPDDYVSYQDELVDQAIKKYNPALMYSGLTMNPPAEEMKQFFIDNYKKINIDLLEVLKSIDSRDKVRDYTQYRSNNFNILPFGQSNKKAVAAAYRQHDAMERLYPYTRSCEAFSDKEEHCGNCFFCAERWWGFGRLV